MKKNTRALHWGSVACVVLVFLTTVISVYAADPYWLGHKWNEGKAKYRIDASVPGDFHDDIESAASKWSAPSPFYFYRVYSEVQYGGGALVFGDPPWWSIAYTDVIYWGSDKIRSYLVTFDADVPQGWTESPCWQVWDSRLRLFSVALHELGHAVDLSPSQTRTQLCTASTDAILICTSETKMQ